MDEQYIISLYNQLGGESKFGQFEDFKSLITSDPSYQKAFHDSFGESTLGPFNDFSSLVSKQPKKKGGFDFLPNPMEQAQQTVQVLGEIEEMKAQKQGVSLAPQGTFLRQMQRSSLASESAPVPLELPSKLEERKYENPIEPEQRKQFTQYQTTDEYGIPTKELQGMGTVSREATNVVPEVNVKELERRQKVEAETPEFLKPSIQGIKTNADKNTINFVKDLNYQFSDAGFEFSNPRLNQIQVKTPDGDIKTVYHNPTYPEQSVSELQDLLKTESSQLRGIDRIEKLYKEDNKKFSTKYQVEFAIKEQNREQNELNSKTNDFLKRKTDAESALKSINEMPIDQRPVNYRDLKFQAEQNLSKLDEEANEIQKSIDLIPIKKRNLETAIGKYELNQSTQGTWIGQIKNTLLTALGSVTSGFVGIGVDIKANVIPLPTLLGKENYEQKVKLYSEQLGLDVDKVLLSPEYFDKLSDPEKRYAVLKAKEYRQMVEPLIRDEYQKGQKYGTDEDITFFEGSRTVLREAFGDVNTTEQWEKLTRKNWLANIALSSIETLPASIGPSAFIRRAQLYSYMDDALNKEFENDPDFKNISENEKLLVKAPIALASAWIQDRSFTNIVKNTALAKSITGRALLKATEGMTPMAFKNLLSKEASQMLADGVIKVVGGGVMEFETGVGESLIDIGVKDIYNIVKDKKMFDSPDTVLDIAATAFMGGIEEMIGSTVITVPLTVGSAFKDKKINDIPNHLFDIFVSSANDVNIEKAFIQDLKSKITSGEMTKQDAVDLLNNYRNSVGLLRSVPPELNNEDKKKAMSLLRERKELEQKKEGKDDALAKPIQNKIDAINEQLTKISEDALQKQAAGEVPVQSEAGVGETMVQGEPKAGPQVTPEQTIISPEENKRKEELTNALNNTPTGSATITIGDTTIDRAEAQNELNSILEKEKTAAKPQPTKQTTVEAFTSAPTETKAEIKFTSPEGTEVSLDGNEQVAAKLYDDAVATPEAQRTQQQNDIVQKMQPLVAAAMPTTVSPSTEVTPTTEAKVEFTEQDRARKAELEEAMRTADKRRKNIMVGDTSIPKADVKAELDALNQKEKASKEPTPTVKAEPTTETAPEQQQRTAEQEADFLETLLGAPRQETTPEGKPKEKPKGKKASDKVRDLKVKGPKGLQSNILGVPIAIWNAAMDTIAAAIDAGVAVSAAIRKGAEYIKKNYKGKWDSNAFNDRVKGSITGARARLSMANSQMPDNRNNEDAIVEEMNKLAPYEADFQEPSPSDKTKEVDPIKESSSIFKSLEKLIDFLKGNKEDKYFKKNKYNLLRYIQDFNGIPMLLGMSDILAAGTILDSMGGEITVGGGLLFNIFGGNENAQENIDKAWAGVNENGADNQFKNALKVYEANKELFERLWAEGRLPYGQIPMAIMRMANTAINSNEAIFRYVLPYLQTLPIENRKAALKTLLESINKKKENDSGANWMEEFSNKLNDGTIQSKEEAIAFLNEMLEGETNVTRIRSINSFITTITPKTVEFSGENSVIEKLNKKQERVNAYIVSKFIEDNNIDTIDGFFNAIAKDAEDRAESKNGKSQLALPQRSYIFDQLFSKEGVGTPNTQFIKDLFKGVENPRKELFTATHIYNAIGEKSMMKAKQGEVVAIMGINVKENSGIGQAKHKNYGWGPKGSIIALIKNPMHGIDVFPEFRAKASRIFKAKKKAALTPEELSRMEALESALDGIDKNATTVTVDGKEISVEAAKKELAKYNKKQAVELPTMEAVAQQTGGAFFMDKAFVGTTARAQDIKMLDMLIGKLRYAFPGVSVTYTQEEFDSFMNQEGTKIKQSKDGLIIYGVTKDGKIFLNPAAQSLRTPIHEFGHIWVDFLRSKASGKKGDMLLKKGFDLVRGTPEHLHAIELYGDSDLALEEALVELIATKGETLINAADRSNFKSWLNAVFKYIQEKFKGFKAVTQVGIKDMSLDDFINVALSDLFSGKELSSKFDAATESSADYRYSLTQDIQTAIETARKNGISEEGIRTFLKRRGLDDAKINEILEAKTTTKGKKELNEQTLPGYDEMMAKVDAMIARQIKRGIPQDKIAKNLDALLRKFDAYINATDAQKKALEQEARNRIGADQRRAPSLGRILGAFKDITNLGRKDKTTILNNIMKLAKDAANDLANEIKAIQASGKISVNQFKAIQKRFSKVNFSNERSIASFVDYITNVFKDAEYANKLSEANKLRSNLKGLSKNKDKNGELRELSKMFSEIDPAMVENIDDYLDMASKIEESTKGSRLTATGVRQADMVNISTALDYINEAMKNQQEVIKDRLANEVQNFMGVDVSDLSYEKLMELVELMKMEEIATGKDKELLTEKIDEQFDLNQSKGTIIKNAVKKMFDTYSSIIEGMFKTGLDPFVDYDETLPYTKLQFKASDMKMVREFMNMDLNTLTAKEALMAVDALNNFLTNRSTAGMGAVLAKYTARQNAKMLQGKNIIAKALNFLFIKGAGRFMSEQLLSLPMLFERMFKSPKIGLAVMRAMGVNKIMNGAAEASTMTARVVEDYLAEFAKRTPNGKAFNDASNIIERGMVAFMSRTIVGTEQQTQKEFNDRKRLIEESIEVLSEGTAEEQQKAAIYQEVYDKLLADAKTINDVKSKADKTNVDAVDWWVNEWSKHYDDLADASLNYYNTKLDKDVYYTTDRYSKLDTVTDENVLQDNQSAYHFNNGNVTERKAGSLRETKKKTGLPKNDEGKVSRYVNLSFDSVNASSLYDAMTDIKTIEGIKQVKEFQKTKEYNKIVPTAEDRKILNNRITLAVRNIRQQNQFESSELDKMVRALDKLASFSATLALAGPTQIPKQTVSIAFNTLVNGGMPKLNYYFDKSKREFIQNSGRAIANRGPQSQVQLESINRMMDEAARSTPAKAMELIKQANDLWLKIFLANPDAYIAKASWLTYYEKSLKDQKIDTSKIDYNTHEINEEAADYAQMMVDRQQNITDTRLAGQIYSNEGAGGSLKKFLARTMLPLASFRINQYQRISSDATTLTSKTASLQDKGNAARSLAAFGVEQAVFKGIAFYLGVGFYMLADRILGGGEEDEEEKQKKWDSRYKILLKTQATGAVTDVFSPAPPLDFAVKYGFNSAMDLTQKMIGVADEDKMSIYTEDQPSFANEMGMYGIAIDKALAIAENVNMARTGKFTDKYGNEKFISEEGQEVLKWSIVPSVILNLGLLPGAPEFNNIMGKVKKEIQHGGQTLNKMQEAEAFRGHGSRTEFEIADPKEYNRAKNTPGDPLYELNKTTKEKTAETAEKTRGKRVEKFGEEAVKAYESKGGSGKTRGIPRKEPKKQQRGIPRGS
jgi:hypothetical protein